jgi:hypothetical protein
VQQTDGQEETPEANSSHEQPKEIQPSQSKRRSSTSSEDQTVTHSTQDQSIIENIKISAKININLNMMILLRNASISSSNEESDLEPSPQKQTPRKATPNVSSPNKILVRKTKQAASAGSASKTTPKMLNEVQRDDFQTSPKQTNQVGEIYEDLQKILDSLYGETWKTPQLLRLCRSKTFQNDLRKSIYANNFDNCEFSTISMNFSNTQFCKF